MQAELGPEEAPIYGGKQENEDVQRLSASEVFRSVLKILSAQAEGDHLAGQKSTLAMLASQTDWLLAKGKTESSTTMQILWRRYKPELHGTVQIVELPCASSMMTRLFGTVKQGKLVAGKAAGLFRACGRVHHHRMRHRHRKTCCSCSGCRCVTAI